MNQKRRLRHFQASTNMRELASSSSRRIMLHPSHTSLCAVIIRTLIVLAPTSSGRCRKSSIFVATFSPRSLKGDELAVLCCLPPLLVCSCWTLQDGVPDGWRVQIKNLNSSAISCGPLEWCWGYHDELSLLHCCSNAPLRIQR